ncbi:efflux RND transporter periplasmic adaptor subunit [Haliangium sp.]|uniref:efflux RND transporter periplasmic adaptor subunit n=1 Tax=Haliangium sp. TaxID=2663208 RepID=UPI003D0D39CB
MTTESRTDSAPAPRTADTAGEAPDSATANDPAEAPNAAATDNAATSASAGGDSAAPGAAPSVLSPASGPGSRRPGPRRWPWIAVALGCFGLGVWAGTSTGSDQPDRDHAGHADEAGHGAQVSEWTCSMHPQIRSPEPGACPICGMDLIPVPHDGGGQAGLDPARVRLSEAAKAMARIRAVPVESRARPGEAVRLLGRMDYDETRIRTVTAWTAGRIDRLRVATTGQRIRAGQVIADLYSPELYSAQQDLILAAAQVGKLADGTEMARAAAESALAAARRRLRLLGLSEVAVTEMEQATAPSVRVPIRAPFAGTVIERMVSEGNYVSAGTGLYRIVDLSRLWVQLDAYETDLVHIEVGQPVALEVQALPGHHFTGQVAFIDPVIDPRTRTARIRVVVDNRGGKLRPGMFAEATIEAEASTTGAAVAAKAGETLVIPTTAPLFTGRRSLVYVEVPDAERPTYEAREVELGPRLGEVYPVLSGLRAGESVVVHGAFALDADLQIRGGDSMMARGDDRDPDPYAGALDVPAPVRATLAPVVRAYLQVQDHLADDALAPAQDAARALTEAVAGVSLDANGGAGGPDRELAAAWARLGPPLATAAGQVVEAADLDPARRAFDALSQALLDLLVAFGNPLDEPIRLAFCPMAFGDRGAYWVQRGEDIENSYYGAEMFTCGVIETTVEAARHLPADAPGVAAEGAGQP